MLLAFAGTCPDLIGTRSDWAGQLLAQASPGWLWPGLPESGWHWARMNLALPWSDLLSQLAQVEQDWACQGKLALAQPDPDLSGRDLVLALSGSGPGMVASDVTGPAGT